MSSRDLVFFCLGLVAGGAIVLVGVAWLLGDAMRRARRELDGR
jgi:hypothetical protein